MVIIIIYSTQYILVYIYSQFVKVTGYPREREPPSPDCCCCMGGNTPRNLMTSAFQLTDRNEGKYYIMYYILLNTAVYTCIYVCSAYGKEKKNICFIILIYRL